MAPGRIYSTGVINMGKRHWKTYLFWILFTEMVGALSGWLTRDATRIYQDTIVRPPLSPPGLVFPIVWFILYALMGISVARVYLTPASQARSRGLTLYLVQLAFNFFWSILFFSSQRFGFALIWLAVMWVLILWMILVFRRIDRPAAWLQLPYLIWTAFAFYLNFGVWRLN